ncbi:MAG TPA: SRPBCC family protein [Propionibacteriaceae bacterium]
MSGHVVTAQCEIDAPPEKVWQALTDPQLIKKYMFGSEVRTDSKPGSPITWQGEFEGRKYMDKGEIITVEPGRRLEVTHFSPLTGQEDRPENYHRVSYELQQTDGGTSVRLTQDNSSSAEEAEHSAATWQMMLDGLKKVAEQS